MDQEVMETIKRLRRNTTNRDVLLVCDTLEKLLLKPQKAPEGPKAKFDKVAYQREYMKRWRAAKRAQSG